MLNVLILTVLWNMSGQAPFKDLPPGYFSKKLFFSAAALGADAFGIERDTAAGTAVNGSFWRELC